ncbi:Polyisoprenoid-binding protein YceI [bacterium A37T11]|nr:Polyisoprenoid-binding protein YceI [bacterium A37T11]
MSNHTWLIDANRSSIRFEVVHMIISKVSGYFGAFEGSLTTPSPDSFEAGEISLTIHAGSLTTKEAFRDDHLKSQGFLDAAHYPVIRFQSTSFAKAQDGTFILSGNLTIKDRVKHLQMTAVLSGEGRIEEMPEASFSIQAILNRKDFGLTYGPLMEAGGMIISDEIKVSADIIITKQ